MKPNRTTAWCVALTTTTVLNYWRLFFTSQYSLLSGIEGVRQAYSWLNLWIRSVSGGSFPLWDQYAYGGYAFPGEMQTAAFYPPYFLLLLFPRNRFGLLSAMEFNGLYITAHVLAALFMFALVRELKLSRFAAFVAGFCFSCSGFVGKVPAGWPHMLQSAIWLPLIALFLLRALSSTGRYWLVRNAVFSGFFLGLSILAGGLHMAISQAIFLVSAVAYYAIVYQSPGRSVSRNAYLRIGAAGAIAVGAGLCLGAIQLLPSHLYSQHSLRWLGAIASPANVKIPYRQLTESALPPAALPTLLFPIFDIAIPGEVWTPYIGVLPFLLAALAVARRWSNLWVQFLLGLSVATLLYSMAGASALHGVLYATMPFLWLAREATRFIYLTTFCLTVLAAYGLDYMCTAVDQEHVWAVLRRWLWYSIGLCLAVFVLPVFFSKIGGYWQYFSLLLMLMSSILLLHALSKSNLRMRPAFRLLVIGLIFFDFYGFNQSAENKLEGDRAGQDEVQVLNTLKGVADFLKTKSPPFRVKILREPEPNIEDSYGIQGLAGGGVTLDQHYLNLLGEFDLLNAEYFVRPATATEQGPVYKDPHWKVYKNPNAFPRFWIVHGFKKEFSDGEMLSDMQSRHAELRQVAFVAEAPTNEVSSAVPGASEVVRVDLYSANEINLTVNASSPGLLVLGEIYYPEWQASVNGRDAKILRTDEALRSVSVPAGQSVVRFRYRPYTVYVGAFFSVMVGILAAALLWLTPERRNRRKLAQVRI